MSPPLTLPDAITILAGATCGLMALLGLYGRFWWYDNVAHLLGGIFVGRFGAWGPSPAYSAAVLAVTVGVLWEGYEYREGIKPWAGEWAHDRAMEDTLLDLVFVGAGGLAIGALVVIA